jgi:hypothetical protein
MSESWKERKQIPQDELQDRLQTIKELGGGDEGTELYEIVKDTGTGEHYLHYAYLHLTVADGTKESFHQLLPLESDDVLGLMFGEQPHTYPDHWQRSFLRNGPDGTYVWFDPSETIEGAGADAEQLAGDAADILGAWKREGARDPESVKRILDEINRKLSKLDD